MPTVSRRSAPRARFVVGLVTVLFILHQDVWLWRDARLVLGLPVGLAYHVAFCVAVTLALLLAVRWSWPREVPTGEDDVDGEVRE